jgi:uncharacterized protein YneF (UPF0154 family)
MNAQEKKEWNGKDISQYQKDWEYVRRGLWLFLGVNILIGMGSLVVYYFNSKAEQKVIKNEFVLINKQLETLQKTMDDKVDEKQFNEFKTSFDKQLNTISEQQKTMFNHILN